MFERLSLISSEHSEDVSLLFHSFKTYLSEHERNYKKPELSKDAFGNYQITILGEYSTAVEDSRILEFGLHVAETVRKINETHN